MVILNKPSVSLHSELLITRAGVVFEQQPCDCDRNVKTFNVVVMKEKKAAAAFKIMKVFT